MAVKFGKAMDLFVVVLSRSPSKEKEALEVMKADKFLVTEDPEQFKVGFVAGPSGLFRVGRSPRGTIL